LYRAYFVEDKPLVLEAFMSNPVFLECGFINAGHCVNPVEAVKEIQKINPDVVFTDLKMPVLNGVELMEELKRAGYNGEFVIVSAYGEFEESRRFFTMDGFDYLIKPVSEHDLQTLLVLLPFSLKHDF
jgi:two-component system response regulator YesN